MAAKLFLFEPNDRADDFVNVHHGLARLRGTDKVRDLANDVAGAYRLNGGLLQGSGNFIGIPVAGLQPSQTATRVIGDGRKRLVDLMGERRSHFAHGAEPQRVREFRFVLPRAFLRLLAIRVIERRHPR